MIEDEVSKNFTKLIHRTQLLCLLMVIGFAPIVYMEYNEYQKTLAFKQQMNDMLTKDEQDLQKQQKQIDEEIQKLHHDLTGN